MKGIDVNQYFTVGETAKRIGARARDITALLYEKDLAGCRIQSGRRMIPEEKLEIIAMLLRRAGRRVTPPINEEGVQ